MIDGICADCIHAEVCGWCDSVTQDACDFFDDDSEYIKIPCNATNGDIIKAAFPRAETWIDEVDHCMRFDLPEDETLECFNIDWWNMSYKGE